MGSGILENLIWNLPDTASKPAKSCPYPGGRPRCGQLKALIVTVVLAYEKTHTPWPT
jgi:hypothetical protein